MTEEGLLFKQAEEAMQKAADGVVEEAIRTGGKVVVFENGLLRCVSADKLRPTENGNKKTPHNN
jgi:hypothetical protein